MHFRLAAVCTMDHLILLTLLSRLTHIMVVVTAYNHLLLRLQARE